MNRNMKLKPLAPRPVIDQGCQQGMAYPSCTSSGDGRNGSINRNAFVGANLGVHASPLEAVTSMDPKDYVWGGGCCYNPSYYSCPSSGSANAPPCYYPSAVEYPVSHQYSKRSAQDTQRPSFTTFVLTQQGSMLLPPGSLVTALDHHLLHCRLRQSIPLRVNLAVHAVWSQLHAVCGEHAK